MAFGLDDILWIIAGGTYVTSKLTGEMVEQESGIGYFEFKQAVIDREKNAMLVYSMYADKELEKECVTLSRNLEETWRRLELFKRENPVWCYLVDASENVPPEEECDKLSWADVGCVEPRHCDNLVDMLMQTMGKREENTLIKIIEYYFVCRYGYQRRTNGNLPEWCFANIMNDSNRSQLRCPDISKMFDYRLSKRRLRDPWMAHAPKALIEYLESAEGEEHEVAVYDTGYEFDPKDPGAVRFIAWKAMEKAFPVWYMTVPPWVMETKGEFLCSYECQMPKNGSVSLANDIIENPVLGDSTNPVLRDLFYDRIDYEDAIYEKHGCEYVPDGSQYAKLVVVACHNHNILISDLSPRKQARVKSANVVRKVSKWIFSHIPLLMIIAGILLFAFFILAENSVFGLTPVGSSALDYGIAERTRYIFTCLSLIIYGILIKVFLVKPGLATAVGIVWGILSLAQCSMH